MRPFLLGAAGGAAVGGGVAYALLRRDRGSAAVEGKTPPGETVHPAMRLGWPTGTEDLLRVRDGFVASYDARTRNPRWVLEVLNTSTMSGPGTRERSNFVEDATLDERFRAKLADFRGSGYDRGHLAAAAGHKNSQRAMDETLSCATSRRRWATASTATTGPASSASPETSPSAPNSTCWSPRDPSSSPPARPRVSSEPETSTPPSPRPPSPLPTFPSPTRPPRCPPRISPSAAARPSTAWERCATPSSAAPELVPSPPTSTRLSAAAPEGSDHSRRHAVAAAAFVVPNAPVPPDTPLERSLSPSPKLEVASGLCFFRGEGALGGGRRRRSLRRRRGTGPGP